jgi:integrase
MSAWLDDEGVCRHLQVDESTLGELVAAGGDDPPWVVLGSAGRRWETARLDAWLRRVLGQPAPGPTLDLRVVGRAFVADRRGHVTDDRIERYERALEQFFRWLEAQSDVPGLQPQALTRARLQAWHVELRKRLGDATVYTRLTIIQAWWAWACESDEYGAVMPPARRLRVTRPGPPATIAPSWAEMDACIRACPGWLRPLATVLRFTGLRVRQALRLRRDDVDLEAGVLHIRPELGKSRQERRGRYVPLSPHLVAMLRKWPEDNGGWLITWPSLDRVANRHAMRSAWTDTGIAPAKWRGRPHHAFRKGFHTGLVAAGAHADAIDHLVGHAAIGVRGVYTDPTALPLKAAVALIPPLRRR